MSDAERLYRVIVEVRVAFRTLRALSEALHGTEADAPSAAMRAVLEHIATEGPATVPDIARAKLVSRQSIQTKVDGLGELGFIDLEPNPSHRRSALVVLSGEGRARFAAMRAAEAEVLARLAARFEPDELDAAVAVLSRLVAAAEDERHQMEGETT